jgi:hypothetical protein
MLSKQLWLWPGIGETEPYPKRHFPDEAIPTLELLFYQGVEASRTGPNCPYRAGLSLSCDCQAALDLVRLLGRDQPSCSNHRCPVRQLLAKTVS